MNLYLSDGRAKVWRKKRELQMILSIQPGAPLRILGPLDSIFTRALLWGGGGGWGCWYPPPYSLTELPARVRPEPVFFSPSPKSDYSVSAIKIVQFCM